VQPVGHLRGVMEDVGVVEHRVQGVDRADAVRRRGGAVSTMVARSALDCTPTGTWCAG
jgi:hypothetical protein